MPCSTTIVPRTAADAGSNNQLRMCTPSRSTSRTSLTSSGGATGARRKLEGATIRLTAIAFERFQTTPSTTASSPSAISGVYCACNSRVLPRTQAELTHERALNARAVAEATSLTRHMSAAF
jgi:hypothetical protein